MQRDERLGKPGAVEVSSDTRSGATREAKEVSLLGLDGGLALFHLRPYAPRDGPGFACASAVSASAATACGPTYTPVSAHTISVSENVERDVIWVLRDGNTLIRCTNAEKGPVCTPVLAH